MKLRKKYFTLFEMLISATLLIFVAAVLLRMFVLTGDYWHYTDGQNDLYLDSKILFNLMDDELSNALYDHSTAGSSKTLTAPLYIGTFNHSANDPISYKGNTLNSGTTLCFVTRSKRDSDAKKSDICKVAYVFYPPLKESSSGYTFLNDSRVPGSKNGVIVRVNLDEDDSANFEGDQSLGDFYKFNLSNAKQVIDGVLDFKVTAYKFDNSDSGDFEKLAVVNDSEGKEGYKNVRAIRVTMTLMAPDKCQEFRTVYQSKTENEQDEFLQKHSRTFSRMFWIKPINAAD